MWSGLSGQRCGDCTCGCPLSEHRQIVELSLRETAGRLERGVRSQGFAILEMLDLSHLAREHLELETEPLLLFYLSHPVLLLQSFLSSGLPHLFRPWLVVLRPETPNQTLVCVSPSCLDVANADTLARVFARRMSERLHRVARSLGT